MGMYTDFFLAEEAEAEAIASIATTEEHSFEDWPHLSMPDIGELELLHLWGLLNGNPKGLEDVSGDSLFQELDEEGGVFVTRVKPAFIEALAVVKTTGVKALAGRWGACASFADWDGKQVAAVLRQLVAFAQRAEREGKPVLQLSVL